MDRITRTMSNWDPAIGTFKVVREEDECSDDEAVSRHV